MDYIINIFREKSKGKEKQQKWFQAGFDCISYSFISLPQMISQSLLEGIQLEVNENYL